jgi:hypothetical protein
LANECPQKFLSNPRFKPGDWLCLRCQNVNFSRRAFCNNCGAAKPTATGTEERSGFGGGFRENANKEYKKHNSEDDELDDFGRTKKAFRGRQVATRNIVSETADSVPAVPTAGDAGTVPNDDDDDDDDGGKYDAWGSDSDGEKPAKVSRSPDARRRSRSRSRSPKRDSRK